jgi:hypothetical protein
MLLALHVCACLFLRISEEQHLIGSRRVFNPSLPHRPSVGPQQAVHEDAKKAPVFGDRCICRLRDGVINRQLSLLYLSQPRNARNTLSKKNPCLVGLGVETLL